MKRVCKEKATLPTLLVRANAENASSETWNTSVTLMASTQRKQEETGALTNPRARSSLNPTSIASHVLEIQVPKKGDHSRERKPL